jgi:transcriptional regulator GlxA family with amidase domain
VVSAVLLPRLRRARDLADRHYAQPLDLGALATAAAVKYHFVRCFAETYGETPMRYLTRRRIERARDLLRSANLTVTEVCMLVGFSSLGSFSSRFREQRGHVNRGAGRAPLRRRGDPPRQLGELARAGRGEAVPAGGLRHRAVMDVAAHERD